MAEEEPMTRQQVFDLAVRGLASQGFRRSVDAVGHGCRYRGDQGRRCAVGWLIEGIPLSDHLNGKPVRDLLMYNEAVRNRIGHIDPDFLGSLQEQHDSAYDLAPGDTRIDNPDEMRANLRKFARCYSLSTAVLEEVTK